MSGPWYPFNLEHAHPSQLLTEADFFDAVNDLMTELADGLPTLGGRYNQVAGWNMEPANLLRLPNGRLAAMEPAPRFMVCLETIACLSTYRGEEPSVHPGDAFYSELSLLLDATHGQLASALGDRYWDSFDRMRQNLVWLSRLPAYEGRDENGPARIVGQMQRLYSGPVPARQSMARFSGLLSRINLEGTPGAYAELLPSLESLAALFPPPRAGASWPDGIPRQDRLQVNFVSDELARLVAHGCDAARGAAFDAAARLEDILLCSLNDRGLIGRLLGTPVPMLGRIDPENQKVPPQMVPSMPYDRHDDNVHEMVRGLRLRLRCAQESHRKPKRSAHPALPPAPFTPRGQGRLTRPRPTGTAHDGWPYGQPASTRRSHQRL